MPPPSRLAQTRNPADLQRRLPSRCIFAHGHGSPSHSSWSSHTRQTTSPGECRDTSGLVAESAAVLDGTKAAADGRIGSGPWTSVSAIRDSRITKKREVMPQPIPNPRARIQPLAGDIGVGNRTGSIAREAATPRSFVVLVQRKHDPLFLLPGPVSFWRWIGGHSLR